MTFKEVSEIDVNGFVEKKNNLTYLSWAHAWRGFLSDVDSQARYEIVKNDDNLPYFEDLNGAMVYTKVKAILDGVEIEHEMWLPVMDYKNDTMKSAPYSYERWNNYKKKTETINVNAYTMFDINKTVMRCLVKNLAMFGYGIYIYAGEDLPVVEEVKTFATASKATEEDKKNTFEYFKSFCDKQQVNPREFLEWCGVDMEDKKGAHNSVVKWLNNEQLLTDQLLTYKHRED